MIGLPNKIVALFLIATSLTACGSGQNSVTRNFKQVTDGVEAQSSEIKLRNVLVVKSETGEGVLVGTLINVSDQTDQITAIDIDNTPAKLAASEYQLVKNQPIIFVGDSANADAAITRVSKVAGDRTPVTFTFAKASPVTVSALIVNGEGIYKELKRSMPVVVVLPSPTP